MSDLIDREKALRLMCHFCKHPCDGEPKCASWYTIHYLDAEPTVHAHWIEEMWGDGWNEWTDLTCSACREKFKKFSKTKRCPNCGAIMDEEGNR